ncbi:MAG: GTPase [Nocardioides sp.]|jgi:GTP-binding protein EngB required for normal cell division
MTSLIEGAKRLLSRGSDVGARVAGLEEAVEAGRGRLPDTELDRAAGVVARADRRLKLSADHTVVALAGATGSGKSSTFNAITGLDVSAVGVRRPTTSWTTACVWGEEGASELLDWLEIAPRHRVVRNATLEVGREDLSMQGVVLLDLPDHDSTEVSHHLEVDRLVQLADLLVWVLDPQKYADAAIHDRYLAPLKTHKDVMMVVLNQIDTVPPERREAMIGDVQRLLAADGLYDVPVRGISAKQGIGVDELRREISERAAAKKAARSRVEADVAAAAHALAEISGNAEPGKLGKERVAGLNDALADAAGVPTVVAAVEKSTRMRAGRATGWPVVAWVTKLKPDPLKRLHLDLGAAGKILTGTSRTSIPEATAVQRARVDSEVRELADEVSGELTRPWQSAIRRASVSHLDDVGDRLDSSLASTDLGVEKLPVWAGVVRALQWALILTAIAGTVWLGAIFGLAFLSPNRDIPVPEWQGFPVPTLMLLGGVVAGLLLALVCRFLVAATAKSRARAADKRLRTGISTVTDELVIAPIQAELDAYTKTRDGLRTAVK